MTIEISVRRSYDVPAQKLYDAWTDIEQLGQWLCAGGSIRGTVRVGGTYDMDMPYQGKLYDHHGRYLRLEPPHLIEFTWSSEGTNRQETIVRVEITDLGSGCEMVLTHTKLLDQASADNHRFGWIELASLLAKHVGSK